MPSEAVSQPTEPEPNWAEQQIMLAVAKAREDFFVGYADRLAVLEQVTKALRQGMLGSELRLRAQQEAHKLAGALGSFGFALGSRLAQEIEHMLQGRNSIDRAVSLRLCELVSGYCFTQDFCTSFPLSWLIFKLEPVL